MKSKNEFILKLRMKIAYKCGIILKKVSLPPEYS